MIRQVFDRDELSRYVEAVRGQLGAEQLRGAVGKAATGAGLEGDPVEQLRAQLPDVSSALASSGARAPEHRIAPYLSRDPVQSLLQSTLEQKLREQGVPDASPERRNLFERIVEHIRLLLHPVRYGPTDRRWVIDIAEATLDRLAAGNHAFNETPAVRAIGDDARIVVVGDWGSGLERAKDVAGYMAKEVVDALANQREVHVIHLGDVYYSGTHHEVKRNVLAAGMWPVTPEQASRGVASFSLNGNHDMYSGGFGYFDTLLGDPRFAAQHSPDGKPTSFFRLTSPSWEIVGLDTSWNSDPLDQGRVGVLHDPQARFVAEVAAESDKKLMLLSHHQLFSVYDTEDLGTELGQKLGPVLSTGRVTAWLWGHEHRCMIFDPVANVKFVRCIGHGGIPVPMDRTPADGYPKGGVWEERSFYRKSGEHWARFGFVVLDFAGESIQVRYINDGGDEAHPPETIA